MNTPIGGWNRVEIAGKPADVYEPSRPAEHSPVVLHLHGHGGRTLAGNPAFTAEFERHGVRAVCPHGGRSWWLDIVCPEFDPEITPLQYLTRSVVPFIAECWGTRPPMIGLTGNSMGGQGVLQLAYRRPRKFPVVAALSPAVDFHNWHGQGLPLDEMFPDREAARQRTVTLELHPLNWPRHQLLVCDPTDDDWFEGAERLAMKLRSMGIPFESDFATRAGGHSWDYFNHMAEPVVSFVAERLESESRRLQ